MQSNHNSFNKKILSKLQIFILTMLFLFDYYVGQILSISNNEMFTSSKDGSIYGGVQIYIKAQGIDNVDFNNKITIGDINCEIINYYTTENQLVCSMPPGNYGETLNASVRVWGFGIELACQTTCTFNFRKVFSPYIRAVIPSAVVVGEKIQMLGYLLSSNSTTFLDVRIGGSVCDKSPYEKSMYLYGREEYFYCNVGQDMDAGYYNVKLRSSTYTGFANVLRSASYNSYKEGTPYHVKVHPKIESLSSNAGYTSGQKVSIKGNSFGSDKTKVSVDLEGFKVEVLEVSNTEIKIQINQDIRNNIPAVFKGGSGLEHRFTRNLGQSLDQFKASANYPNAPNQTISIKLTVEAFPDESNYIQRYSGLFFAPVSGNYKFKTSSDDQSILQISKVPVDFSIPYNEATMMENLCTVTSYTYFRKFFTYDSQSCHKDLQGGQYYYILVLQREGGGYDDLSLTAQIPNLDDTKVNKSPKITKIKISNKLIPEEISVKIWNATSGTFKMTFIALDTKDVIIYNKVVDLIPYNASATDMKNRVRNVIGGDFDVTRYQLDKTGLRTSGIVDFDGCFEWVFSFTTPRSYQVLPVLNLSNLFGSKVSQVLKITNPSPNISGSFKIKITSSNPQIAEAVSSAFTFDVTEVTMLESLMNLSLLRDGVTIERGGDYYNGYFWNVIWDPLVESVGNVYTISIVESSITGGDPANPAKIEISVLEPASNDLFYYEIPSELLSTFHDKPQVTVSVSGIGSACSNLNCGYSVYDVANIPTATWAINAQSVVITFAAGYASLPDLALFTMNNFVITYGGVPCENSSLTLPGLTCTLPKNSDETTQVPAGDHKPVVHLNQRGFLIINGEPITYPLTISSASPANGSLGGGTLLSIQGKGFSEKAVVTINGQICQITLLTNILIKCITPGGSNGVASLIITQGNLTANSSAFSYSTLFTPTITALSIKSASPVLKNDLVISGTNFGSAVGDLTVDLISQNTDPKFKTDYNCNLTNSSLVGNDLTCRLGGGYSGDYKIRVTRKGYGYSIASSAEGDKFSYAIYVDSINPVSGSNEGGSILTITGANFSTKANENQILIGPKQDFCVVETATPTQLTCRTNKPRSPLVGIQTVTSLGRIVEEAKCRGACNFEFRTDRTPVVTSISPLTGINNTPVTIDGTNLDSAKLVLIGLSVSGGTEVLVEASQMTSFSATQIVFNFPTVPSGDYSISVRIFEKGFATMPINRIFVNEFQLISISPTTGPIGGADLQIVGNGFTPGDIVKINNIACLRPEYVSSALIKCRMASISTANVTLPVKVVRGAVEKVCASCNYLTLNDSPNLSNPRITAFNSVIFTSSATLNLTITGNTPATADVSKVTIKLRSTFNDKIVYDSVSVTKLSATVDVVFSQIPAGIYEVEYLIQDVGYARPNGNDQKIITVNLPAAGTFSMATIQSSFSGGKVGVVTGMGFNPDLSGSVQSLRVCGAKAKILTASFNELTFETPMLLTESLNKSLVMVDDARLVPEAITMSGGVNPQFVNDDDFTTYFDSNSDACWFQYDFGAGYQAYINYIAVFPRLNKDEKYLAGALIRGSQDGVAFTNLATLTTSTIENWNTFTPRAKDDPLYVPWNFRYIRFEGRKCYVSEFKVFGQKYLTQSINSASQMCDVDHVMNSTLSSFGQKVEYRSDKSPIITGMTPKLGPTSGNTSVTFSGEYLSSVTEIRIDDVVCVLGTVSATEVVCVTGPRPTFTEPSIVFKSTHGFGVLGDFTYLYIDRWSDPNTWGGETPPREGESVYVPKGQSLLVDVSPPILKAVIVEGNILWEDVQEQTFDAHYIYIKEGSFKIGTPSKPHLNKLTLTLHGKKEDMTLPGFGNKLIGVMRGTIDIHGERRTKTWSLLQQTANAGSNTITVEDTVDWRVGEEIVIAPTSNSRDFEIRRIAARTSGTITLDKPLKFAHFAQTLRYNNQNYEVRAEVGLLTRNVKIQGDSDSTATKYGVHIMMRGTSDTVRGRFSFIELFNCGQAFQMGRYPIHFHLIGNVIGSYLEGNAIHQSYNRGTTIHGVHYLRIVNSVYYDHMGHGIFWEDSIESNITVEDNLVMGTKVSSSLLESDLSPACFWITRPTSFLRRNHAVGSAAFGFWYDLPGNPTGPSATDTICPLSDEFGVFEDNVSHSNGIGLRIYPQYMPTTYPCRPLKNYDKLNILEDNPPIPAIFRNVLLYSNGQGMFTRNPGALVFKNFAFISNGEGNGFKHPQYENEEFFARIEDSIMVSRSPLSDLHGQETELAIAAGLTDGFKYKNVKFINFNNKTFLQTCTPCDPSSAKGQMGMAHTVFEGVTFENSTFNTFIHWNYPERGRDVVVDKDGCLNSFLGVTGTGGFVTPFSPHLKVPECAKEEVGAISDYPALKCPKTIVLQRFDIFSPDNLVGQKLKIYNTNLYGEITGNNMQEATNFGILDYIDPEGGFRGWAVPMITNQKYNLHFGTGIDWAELTVGNNVLWNDNDQLQIKYNITQSRELYDVFYSGFDNSVKISSALQLTLPAEPVSPAKFGEFYYNSSTRLLTMMVTGNRRGQVLSKSIYCRQTCPKDPTDVPAEPEFRHWNKASDWPSGAIPLEGENVVILPGWKMIIDVDPAKIKTLDVQGSLFTDPTRLKTTLSADNIWIRSTGSINIGSVETPFDKQFEIILNGKKDSPDITLSPLITPANKAIIVAGLMKVIAKTSNFSYTRLKANALIGTNQIQVADPVDWKVGDKLILASTSQKHDEVEYVDISAIDGNVITLATNLVYNHYGAASPISTTQGLLDMRGEVGLLTRNVVIRGTGEDEWGCRILIPGYNDDNGKRIDGQIQLEGVLIRNCGQRDTEHAALDFNRIAKDTNINTINKCSIQDSEGWGINLRASINVKITNNVIANSMKYGVYVKNSKKIAFKENLVIKIRERPEYSNAIEFDMLIGFFYDDEVDMATNQMEIYKNSISSSPWFAWAVPGLLCGSTNNVFTFNVGHSSRAGWFGKRVYQDCQEYSSFTAYRNFEEGFVNRYMIMNLKLRNMIFSDNYNSIAIVGGTESSGNSPKSSIVDTLILGKSMTNCDFCYKNDLDCNTSGLYTALFENVVFDGRINEYRLPLHNSTFSDYLWGGTQTLENVNFENFKQTPGCAGDKSYAIRTNNFVQDTSVYFKMSKIITKNIDRNNMFFFANHTRLRHSAFCAKKDCTGIYNIIIDDLEGAFNPAKKPLQYFGYNRNIAKEGNCTFVPEWNGHECNSVYDTLTILKTISARSPIITPIFTTIYSGGADVSGSDAFSSTVENEKEIPVIVKKNALHNVAFSQSLPDGNIYRLQSDKSDYGVFRMQNNDPATLVANVNGKDVAPIIVEQGKELNWDSYKNQCGSHVFFPSNSTIIFLVSANNCVVTIKQLTTVNIAMRLDVDVADFYNDIGTTTFLDKIAGLLGIQTSQLKIVGIRKGSTIIDFFITSLESTTSTPVDSVKEAEALNTIKENLMDKLNKGEINVGAPVLNLEAQVTVPVQADEGFTNSCRFFKFNFYIIIDNPSLQNEAKSQGLEFMDVSCPQCVTSKDCTQFLKQVCVVNGPLLGATQCDDYIKGKQVDENKLPDNSTKFGFIMHGYVVLILMILKFL